MARALVPKLTGEEQRRLAKHYTENTEAFLLYAKGRYLLDQRNPATHEKARQHFQQAIDRDPNYALAYAALSELYVAMSSLGTFPPKEVMPKARAAAEQALRLDNLLAEAHASLAETIKTYPRDFAGAEKEFKRAIGLDPNSVVAHRWYAVFLKSMGRFDEAIAENDRALTLDPLSLVEHRNRGMILYSARRYDQAIKQCQQALELDPNFYTIYRWLGGAYEQKGLYEQAADAHLKDRVFWKLSLETEAPLRAAYAASGWRGFWQKMLDLKKQQAKHEYVMPYIFAAIYARLGEKDQAFVWLERLLMKEARGWLGSKSSQSSTACAQTRDSQTCSGASVLRRNCGEVS